MARARAPIDDSARCGHLSTTALYQPPDRVKTAPARSRPANPNAACPHVCFDAHIPSLRTGHGRPLSALSAARARAWLFWIPAKDYSHSRVNHQTRAVPSDKIASKSRSGRGEVRQTSLLGDSGKERTLEKQLFRHLPFQHTESSHSGGSRNHFVVWEGRGRHRRNFPCVPKHLEGGTGSAHGWTLEPRSVSEGCFCTKTPPNSPSSALTDVTCVSRARSNEDAATCVVKSFVVSASTQPG